MMISSRARSIASFLSIAAFSVSVYFCWALSLKTIESCPDRAALITAAVSSFNIAILLGWVGFGLTLGAVITVSSLLFVLLLDFRMGNHGNNIFSAAFLVTAWIGYMLTRSKNRLDQLFVLRSEKVAEEINVLANEVKEKNKGIKVLEEKLKRYFTLKEVAESLSTELSMDGISALITDKTLKVLASGGRALLFLADASGGELALSASAARRHPIMKAKKGDVFDHWVLKHKKPLIIEDATKDFRFTTDGIDEAGGVFRSLVEAPIVSGSNVIGVLRVDSPREGAYAQDDLRLLDIVANLAAVAIQNSMLYSRTQELAIKDSLTGLKVRRFFMEAFHREVKRTARKRENLSLLVLDIDHFKEYNDKYGHASGDLILKFIAKTIMDQLEGPDVAGRYGGEELAILLWGKGKKEAYQKADKIRKLIRQRPVTLRDHEASVTVSIGVSAYPEDAVTEEDLIRIADVRLYKAKAGGRDRVCSD